MTKLIIDANFDVGCARYIPHPTTFETTVKSIERKDTGNLGFVVQEAIAVTVLLEQAGLIEWALSTAYNALWVYLKEFIGNSTDTLPPKTSITVNGQDGTPRVIVIDLDVENMEQAKVSILEEIIESKDGSKTHKSMIQLDLKAQKPS